jgi:hypothetical protein
LKIAKGKADRADSLEEQLEKLQKSSISDQRIKLENLESKLRDQHQKELIRLRTAHETEISILNSAHEAEVVRVSRRSGIIEEELWSMKEGFERDKRAAVDQAVAERCSVERRHI